MEQQPPPSQPAQAVSSAPEPTSTEREEEIREQYAPQGRDVDIAIDSSLSGSSDDNDSSLGDDAGSTGSASVTSSIRNYKYENGRRYHAFREGKYILSNDEAEQDRMDLHHHVFRLMLGGNLHRAPVDKSEGLRVMDFGTGTGIWPMDFADEHPNAFVIGADLSPIQPEFVPPNCKFYVDDVESDWVYGPDEAFDLIHGRAMCGSIGDWDALYRNAYENMKPGGWIELQEFEAWIWQIDDPESKNIPNITKWLGLIDEASIKIGKRFNVATEQKQRMLNAGFINAHDDVYPCPVGIWPRDRKMKELGMFQRENMILAVEAYTLGLFTRVLNWSLEECQVLMAKVNEEFRNNKNHMISYFHFIYAQKPPSPAQAFDES